MQDSDRTGYWKGRRILITGASGFVGSWLLHDLSARGAAVVGLARTDRTGAGVPSHLHQATLVQADINDTRSIHRLLRDFHTDTVFHLAAININIGTSASAAAVFETNIRGTWSLLEACRLSSDIERVVVASSRESQEELQPRLGRHPKRHPYHVSKKATELIAQSYSDIYGMPVAISRSDNVYGGGDLNWNRLIPGALRQLLHGRPPTLRSDGTLKRDYVHVQDMVNGYLMLAERTPDTGVRGEIFDFSTGTQTSALSVVTRLCELVGRPDLTPVPAGNSGPERQDPRADPTLDPHPLGWDSHVEIAEGLRTTAEWYADYFRRNPETERALD